MDEVQQAAPVAAQYGRVKGADWFPLLFRKDVMVLGSGGIGSWLGAMLSRIGCNLYIYDMDEYESHNMTGQFVTQKGMGKNKAEMARDMIKAFSPDCQVNAFKEKYDVLSPTNEVVMCGFDNMQARSIAFSNWKNMVEQLSPEERAKCLFMDGRLLAEVLQILSIPGDRPDLIERYEKEFLFNDNEVIDADCTFKQTSHSASMIASLMTGFLTNWAFNVHKGRIVRQVPFYHEYMIPLNMTTNG